MSKNAIELQSLSSMSQRWAALDGGSVAANRAALNGRSGRNDCDWLAHFHLPIEPTFAT